MARKTAYAELTQLGAKVGTAASPDAAVLERVPNPHPGTVYVARYTAPEFTCLCPKTGQPDFATLDLEYVADARCVELKSLKYYMLEFRNKGIFYEAVTNQILDDLVAAISPRRMTVVGSFSARGGITTSVTAVYEKGA